MYAHRDAHWFLAIACALAYWLLHTTYASVAAASLDPGWVLALLDAIARHKDFSREVVFTHGPLGYVFLPYYYPGLYLHLVVSRVLIGAAMVFIGVAYPKLLPALLLMLLTTLGAASGIHAFAFCTIAWVVVMLFHDAGTTTQRLARWAGLALITAFA